MSLCTFRAQNHPQQTARRGGLDQVDDRRTPDEIFQPLNALHRFTIDVAASPSNAKCPRFYTAEQNGLAQSWASERVWCNPPYSDLRPWVDKAASEVFLSDCPVAVLLLPANRTEQGFWQDLIEPYRDHPGVGPLVTTSFLRGRTRFGHPPGFVLPKKGDRPPFGLVIATFTVRRPT